MPKCPKVEEGQPICLLHTTVVIRRVMLQIRKMLENIFTQQIMFIKPIAEYIEGGHEPFAKNLVIGEILLPVVTTASYSSVSLHFKMPLLRLLKMLKYAIQNEKRNSID